MLTASSKANVKTTETVLVILYVGTKDMKTGESIPIAILEDYIADFCDRRNICLSVQPVKYFYVGGQEDGISVTAINYPRFPKSAQEITETMNFLAEGLRHIARQERVSLVCVSPWGADNYSFTLGSFPEAHL